MARPKPNFPQLDRATEGDLILILTDQQMNRREVPRTISLGVLNGINGDYLSMSRFYSISPSETLGGVSIPLVSIPNQAKTRLPGQSHKFKLSGKVSELYVGQDEIVEALMGLPGYEFHAELISKMRKPYI